MARTVRISSACPPSMIGFAYGVTRGLRFLCVSALSAAMLAPIPASSVCASSSDAPGIRRANMATEGPERGASDAGFTRSGTQIRSFAGNPNASGMTPTIVAVSVPSFTVLPMTEASLANRDLQSLSPMTTTGGSVGCSSCSVSVRPSTGGIPISANAFAVISAPRTGSMRPSGVARLRPNATAAPRCSNVFACSRQIPKSYSDRPSCRSSLASQLRIDTTRSPSRIGRRGLRHLLSASM